MNASRRKWSPDDFLKDVGCHYMNLLRSAWKKEGWYPLTQELSDARTGLMLALLAIGVDASKVEILADVATQPKNPIDPFRNCDKVLGQVLAHGTPLQQKVCTALLR